MKGIKFYRNAKKDACLCLISDFSDELKKLIRENLLSICEGEYNSEKFKKFIKYENTLEIFLERFNGKTNETQIGMIGEFLCHLLFIEEYKNYKRMSPFFNMEENSIKKGHDILYYDSDLEIWIVEVKSGELGKQVSVKAKKAELLTRSVSDMTSKLSKPSLNLWRNALLGMNTVVNEGVTKSALESLLTSYQDGSLNNSQKLNDYNVVLVSALFHDLSNPAKIEDILEWKETNQRKLIFKRHIIFSIQKSTMKRIVQFLKDEALQRKGKAS